MANENYTYNPYGNAGYGNGNPNNYYYGGQPGNYGPRPDEDADDESSFNIMEWVVRILHYWYLFVIGVVIAFSAAWLKNRKWIPSYYSEGRVIIKENAGYSTNSALMQGFGVDAGYKNVNNQVIMLGSYDLMSRVVDSLPRLETEYFTQGRFKTRYLYSNNPITLYTTERDPAAYNYTYQIDFLEDGTMHLTTTAEKSPIDMIVRYGDPIVTPFFTGYIMPNHQLNTSGRIFIQFRTKESLVNEFMARLSLHFVSTGSTVLALSLISETPDRDCEFLDKLVDIYLLRNLEQKNEVAENSIRFIDSQLANLSASLAVSQDKITNFRLENKFSNVSAYTDQLMSRLNGYDQQALNIRLRETYFDYLTSYVNSQIESGAVIAPSTLGLNEPMLSSLVQQLNELRIQRGDLTERNVYYAKYTKEMDNVKVSIAEVVRQMRAAMDIEKQDLQLRMSEVETEMQSLPEKELQMVAIERDYRIDDNYYTFFLQKRAESEIQKAGNLPDNTILDRARTTSVTNSGNKKKTTTTFLAIGLLIPLVLILLSELLNNKIRTPRELQKVSGVFHMIGVLRHANGSNPMLVHSHPRSSYAEMLRAIRTRMEFILQRKDKAVVCITSTESGDGKTFLSTNLASLYAMTGRRTLLIDLDVRKPNIHTKLGLGNGQGVTNYLIGACAIEDTIVHNEQLRFDFMRAGSIPPNPGELVHSEKMAQLIISLREQYDYIVIDTSPIGLVSDAYALINNSDLCLFVVRCLQTNKDFCTQALEQIRDTIDNPNKVQLVLSDIPTKGFHHGYRYASGYGYGYGYGSGYGYGYGRSTYGYGNYYGKSHRSGKHGHHYYNDEEEPENDKEQTNNAG